MTQTINPKVEILYTDGHYTLRWDVYELSELTFEESEKALDQIQARTFCAETWPNCSRRLFYLDEEKAARSLGGLAS